MTTAAEYGRHLASLEPPITDDQAEAAARIFVTTTEQEAA